MQHFKRISCSICFILLLVTVLTLLGSIVERKYSYEKYADFYEEEQQFDVLFLGTSHQLNAILPMELWNDYGIVSYNLANYSEPIRTNYWQLINAIKQNGKPKVVVIDLYAVDNGSKINTSSLHNFLDSVPFSLTKIRMVTDLLPKEDWVEYLFNFSLYHNRWEELTDEDLHPVKKVEKGAELRQEVVEDTAPVIIDKNNCYEREAYGLQHLEELIDFCKEEGIEIVLTYLPYSAPESHQQIANEIFALAEEKQVPYLNFFYEDLEINYETDCADIGSHLNASGARKVTNYIGKFLVNQYAIPDRREDERYASWWDDYKAYKDFKIDLLNACGDNVLSYLMLLYDTNYEVTIYLTEESFVYQDGLIMELINNISSLGSLTIEKLPENYYDGNFMVRVTDKSSQEEISYMQYSRVDENEYFEY